MDTNWEHGEANRGFWQQWGDGGSVVACGHCIPRVIEIPTPRWTAYEARRFGVEMPEEVPMTTQERAYTSPIWYKP